MGAAKRREALALAAFVTLTMSVGTAAAAPTVTVIAEAVRTLDADQNRAMTAVRVLRAGGARAAQQLRDAWPSLSSLGQRRALSVLAVLAKQHDAAVGALVEAARSDDEELRNQALNALRRAAPRGRDGLVLLVLDPVAGDRAASLLAQMEPDFAIDELLEAMESDGAADRPGLRAALGAAVELAGEGAEERLAGWLTGEPDVAAVASAALGIALLDTQPGVVTSFVEYAAAKPTDFASTWRLLRSAGAAGQSSTVDRWVQAQLEGSEPWMLRQAAVDAITARGHREAARGSLADPYPRVRASAATALSRDPETLVVRATLARRDTWPFVRAAAVTSLRTEGDAIAVIVASVDDPMSVVRTAAIEVLTAAPGEQGWERVHRRLRANDEWPDVTRAAIGYVAAHCRTDSVDALLRIVMKAAPSSALTEDLNNAARAIETLRTLGTPEALAAVRRLAEMEGVPPTLKMALELPLAEDNACVPSRR